MKYLIVGLGNIGAEYKNTRHNIGFEVADALAADLKTSFTVEKLASYASANYKNRSLHLIKPTTYMNLSGKAVNYWLQQLKIPLTNTLVIVDDLALPFGAVRLKERGSSAGHNGLKDIEAVTGSQAYPRLRLGIGNNYPKGHQANYVLAKFLPTEQLEIPFMLDAAVSAIKSFVTVGPALTMTNFNK